MHTIEIYLKNGAVIEINRQTEDGTLIEEATRLLDALDTLDTQGFIDRNLDGSIRSSLQLKANQIAGYRVYDGLKNDPSRQMDGYHAFNGAITINSTSPEEQGKLTERIKQAASFGLFDQA